MENRRFKSASFKYLVIILALLGIFLRLYKLGVIPKGLSVDEASLGYNSWMIAETGRDEWGQFIPMHFRAFAEWKLPVFIYTGIPLIRIFGLSTLGVRAHSALAGLGSALVWYLIWSKKENKATGLISGLIFLFSFWIFPLSRTGMQANWGVFLFLLGWLVWLYKKYFLSALIFLGAAYTYNVFRILTPIFLAWLTLKLILKTKDFKKIAVLILFGIGCLPIVYFYSKEPTAFLRAQQTGVEEMRLTTVISNYFNHFNPNFLLLQGDENLRHAPGTAGQISYLTVALAVIGLLKPDPTSLFLLAVGPLPAVITRISPHSLRSLGFMIGIYSFAGLGLAKITAVFSQAKSKMLKIIILTGLLFGLIQYGYFYYDYFVFYPRRSAAAWNVGYQEVYERLREIDDHVYFSWEYNQPYIYKLFYDRLNVLEQDVDIAPPDQWHASILTRVNKVHYLSCEQLVSLFDQEETGYFVYSPECRVEADKTKLVDKVSVDNQLKFIIVRNE